MIWLTCRVLPAETGFESPWHVACAGHVRQCLPVSCIHAQVLAWRPLSDGGVEVTTDKGAYTADKLVLAGGAWMEQLVPELKVCNMCILLECMGAQPCFPSTAVRAQLRTPHMSHRAAAGPLRARPCNGRVGGCAAAGLVLAGRVSGVHHAGRRQRQRDVRLPRVWRQARHARHYWRAAISARLLAGSCARCMHSTRAHARAVHRQPRSLAQASRSGSSAPAILATPTTWRAQRPRPTRRRCWR